MNVSFNPAAKQEFAEAAGWYAEQAGERRATDFRNEVMHSLKLIAEHPNLGSPTAWKTRSLSRRPEYWARRRQTWLLLSSMLEQAARCVVPYP